MTDSIFFFVGDEVLNYCLLCDGCCKIVSSRSHEDIVKNNILCTLDMWVDHIKDYPTENGTLWQHSQTYVILNIFK